MSNQLQSYLKVWRNTTANEMNSGEIDIVHPTDENIYMMAEDGGMQTAAPGMLEHLSLCPVCMEKWADWREAITAVEEESTEPVTMPLATHGILRAAATTGSKDPLSSLSGCGRFRLEAAPPIDSSDRWLITLEVVREEDTTLEGREVIARERNGRVLLEGRIRQGRMARYWVSPGDFDLSCWTLIEKDREQD